MKSGRRNLLPRDVKSPRSDITGHLASNDDSGFLTLEFDEPVSKRRTDVIRFGQIEIACDSAGCLYWRFGVGRNEVFASSIFPMADIMAEQSPFSFWSAPDRQGIVLVQSPFYKRRYQDKTFDMRSVKFSPALIEALRRARTFSQQRSPFLEADEIDLEVASTQRPPLPAREGFLQAPFRKFLSPRKYDENVPPTRITVEDILTRYGDLRFDLKSVLVAHERGTRDRDEMLEVFAWRYTAMLADADLSEVDFEEFEQFCVFYYALWDHSRCPRPSEVLERIVRWIDLYNSYDSGEGLPDQPSDDDSSDQGYRYERDMLVRMKARLEALSLPQFMRLSEALEEWSRGPMNDKGYDRYYRRMVQLRELEPLGEEPSLFF